MMSVLSHPSSCLVALYAMGIGACLDPQVSDEVALNGLVLPAGSSVPSAHDDSILERRIADNDGVAGTVPLLSGFAGGGPIRFWDFGEAPGFLAPVVMLVQSNGDGEFEPVAHNTIIDAIPGTSGYSPFWSVLFLEVTDQYQGELITSFAAIEDAQAAGLVYSPILQPFAVNCPVVASDVRLDVGSEVSGPLPPANEFFWQGKTVKYYDLGTMPITESSAPSESSMLVLSREGESPVSEQLRNVDFTGDGDIFDTNNIFTWARSGEGYTPLARRVNVTLTSDNSPLIDTSEDQEVSSFTEFSDVFEPAPLNDRVVALEETEELRNLPQQSQPGGL